MKKKVQIMSCTWKLLGQGGTFMWSKQQIVICCWMFLKSLSTWKKDNENMNTLSDNGFSSD